MIRLAAVTLRLSGHLVLDAVSMQAHDGELLVVEGGRGAGKTLLLEVAGARRRPDTGEVWIANHNLMTLQRDSLPFVRRNIGIASAVPRFLSGLSVLENVMLPLGARAAPVDWAREAAMRALGKLGVLGFATQDPHALSISEVRLVAIARALAGSPPLVLLDDPSAYLTHADTGAVLSALVGAVQRGAVVVCASADGAFATAAARAGARRLRLDAGRLSAGVGPLAVVTERAGRRLTQGGIVP